MRRLAPSAWLSYATYTGYTAEMRKTPPLFLSLIPDDAICQWTLTPEIAPTEKWRGVPTPAKHSIGYLHWCHNRWGRHADRFFLQEVRDMCRDAAEAGFEGLDTYGELSPERSNVEIFYLAWEAFLWRPEMTVEEFADQRLGRLFGGAKALGPWSRSSPSFREKSNRPRRTSPGRSRWRSRPARSPRRTVVPAGTASCRAGATLTAPTRN